MINKEKREFIVSYSPSHFVVADAVVYPEYKEEYEILVQRFHKKYGDVIAWNNHLWSIAVEAENAGEAFMKVAAKNVKIGSRES